MRIAFASCMHSKVFPAQPVWDWIAATQPDHLVLLGDSIYLDVDAGGPPPQQIGDNDFAKRLFALYNAQMAQSSFRALVQGMRKNTVWSIWDDHDFLWDNALGAEATADPVQEGKVRLSTAFQEAFRRALANQLSPGSFPASYNDAVFWDANQPPLTTPSVSLPDDVWLHLSDGRTHRTRTFLYPANKRTLLGVQQKNDLAAAFKATAPGSVNLFASGSTVASYKTDYANDWNWLAALAATRRTLVLSGDIHRNESDAFFTRGFPLHEATSSGAAVKDAVVAGKTRRNFGLVDIDPLHVQFRLFAGNTEETRYSRKLARATWLPVS